MFRRRDLPPALLLVLLIILVMITLSQILVVDNSRYGHGAHNIRRLQMELRQMDLSLHSLMMRNVPSVELNQRRLQNEINANKVARIIAEAVQPNNTAQKGLNTSSVSRPGQGGRSLSEGEDLLGEDPHKDDEIEGHRLTRELLHGDHITDVNNHAQISPLIPPPVSTHPAVSTDSDNARNASPVSSFTRKHTHVTLEKAGSSNTGQMGIIAPVTASMAAGVTSRRPEYCPSVPPGLVGCIDLELNASDFSSEDSMIRNNPEVAPGGTWRPLSCVARHKVAIVIPYRDRLAHLRILLSHLHPFLQRQQLDYHILVVEQNGKDTFNKARIMNAAFVEGMKLYPFGCFVFHDVDLVPEDDRNMYSCPAQPRHMSVAIDEMGYKLAYPELVGGVLAMRSDHFQKLNGYSNLYWGWGAEDDDMASRIMYVGLKITRPPEAVARYKMIKHTKRKPADWRKRLKLLYTGTRRFQFDGLNSLEYNLVHIKKEPLFTHILVDIGKPPKGFK